MPRSLPSSVRTTGVLLLGASLLVGCGEQNLRRTGDPEIGPNTDAQIIVEPTALNFGEVNAGDPGVPQVVSVTNIGTDTLTLEGFLLNGPDAYDIDLTGVDFLLGPDETTTFTVTFGPDTDVDAIGEIIVESNDRDNPEVPVTLAGQGLAPVIAIDPPVFNFGDHAIGCVLTEEVTITNLGRAPLDLQGIEVTPTSPDEFEVSYDWVPGGTTLAQNESVNFSVTYAGNNVGEDTNYVYVQSNDLHNPEAFASQTGRSHLGDELVDNFVQEGNNWTDILFVVDNSCSMSEEQASLAINFPVFFNIISALDIDYHIGVVTTDSGQLSAPSGVRYITPETPDGAAAFAQNVNLGTDGNFEEQGLEYGFQALSAPLADAGGWNDGFLREEAGLRLVVVSDEPDVSPQTPAWYVSYFQGLKVNPDFVTVSGVTGQETGCSGADGDADPGDGYEDAIALTGGLSLSICSSWADALGTLAWTSQSFATTFELSEEPVPSTIAVQLNGAPVTNGWEYVDSLNSVVFDQAHVPQNGDVIDVQYAVLGSCSD